MQPGATFVGPSNEFSVRGMAIRLSSLDTIGIEKTSCMRLQRVGLTEIDGCFGL